ncbi:MAG: D-2-hydroxyacid dehydrogenase [Clostridia bacterium]|nr:D-2-hydroxyacid dehydrogenase [Clostridia bacterium]
MKNILVVLPVQEAHKRYLESMAPDCQFVYSTIPTVTEEQVNEADIIIGNVPPAKVSQAKHLQWMQLNSAGVDPYCKPGIIGPDTILTCATGAYGLAVSEMMVAMSFMLCRKMDLYQRNQMENKWHLEGAITSVWHSTTLILGLGEIGGEYAKRMKALGSHVIGIRRNTANKPDYLDEIYTMDQLDELLPRADFVTMVLPGTPETYHIIDERRMRLMKKGAYLINVGRGNAVDCMALDKVLREGNVLGGAALDVTEPEPLPADHPLWSAPRCIIAPHAAGGFLLPETFERVVRIAGKNMQRFLAGNIEAMGNRVDPTTGSVSHRMASGELEG